jgi:hypothetical protein
MPWTTPAEGQNCWRNMHFIIKIEGRRWRYMLEAIRRCRAASPVSFFEQILWGFESLDKMEKFGKK